MKRSFAAFLCVFGLTFLAAVPVSAEVAYDQRVIFDNSLTPDRYFSSSGKASAPSTLSLVDEKLPVETKNFVTGPNSLRLAWKSMPGGAWTAEVQVQAWRNRDIQFPGSVLYFWCFSANAIAPSQLPRIVLRSNKGENFTVPLEVAPFVQEIPQGKWFEVRVPLNRFETASLRPFEPHGVNSVLFVQGADDAADHLLLIDEIGVGAEGRAEGPLPTVANLLAKGYERHIDLSWDAASGDDLGRFVISRSLDGGPLRIVGIQRPGVHRYADFLGNLNQTARYTVTPQSLNYESGKPSKIVTASTMARPATDDELLTMVQEAAFHYYWEGAHPVSGMTRENLPGDDDIIATGASGFGIMALVVGVDRGFITREEGVQRLLKIARFLKQADRFHGVWPHFMNGATGKRLPVFGMLDNGADLVETSFLLQGLLAARQYFQGNSAAEKDLYEQITNLWRTTEWDWFRRTPAGRALYWHWSPEYTWQIDHPLTGWNEVMITYLLAVASPTHSVPASLYYSGWASLPKEYLNGRTYYGIKLDLGMGTGGPLFFTHYSFMGFDPHTRDRFTNYFENNRNQALINYAYCQRDPHRFKGYSPDSWGLTAVDGPDGYVPYEPTPTLDDGTIAPTGAIASFPYTPTQSLAALKHFYRDLGDRLWSIYGFRDAFNLQQNWFSPINMGLNQAPMVVMIENYRTGLIWKNFMSNPEMQAMQRRIGFRK